MRRTEETWMEPTREMLPPAMDAAPTGWGELILQNGRLAGARHPLEAPLIVVGHGATCDIRLHASAIRRLHCALVLTPAGAVLRELEGKGGTTINGENAGHRYLHDGDEIAFGPFRFTIRMAQDALGEPEHDGEGLDVHGHEPDVKPRPTEGRNPAPAASAEDLSALALAQKEVEEGRLQIHAEKRRLLRLRLRLRQRMHRHWVAERATMRRREETLAADRRGIDKEFERLQAERQELYRARLQQNGEAELGKRQLRDGWTRLTEERERLTLESARLQASQNGHARDLEAREIDLADAERHLSDERRRWEERRVQLEREVEGLDVRVRNQRRKLLVQDEELRRRKDALRETSVAAAPVAEIAPAPETSSAVDAELQRRVAELDRLATELADQRLYLAEQCERLNLARKQWQQERAAAAGALEPLALQLEEREQGIRDREQALAAGEDECGQVRQELIQQRRFLDTWQSRLATRAATWEGERDRLLADVRTREGKSEAELAAIAQLRRRWQQRRAQEIDQVQNLLSACDQLRQECTTLRDDWLKRGKALEQERRALAERALAVKEYRFTFLRQADNPAIVEQRLRRLREKWNSEFESASQPIVRDRHELAADWERLQGGLGQLRTDLTALATRETDLAQREREHEHADLRTRLEHDTMRRELERHRTQRTHYQRQLHALTEEVERLARAMLDEGEAEPQAKAA
jgi:hypothetical protein